MAALIDTDRLSSRFRDRAIDVANSRLLISRIVGSQQMEDLTESPNCEGFGRIRHFRRAASPGWPSNPLPLDPATKALRLSPTDTIRAQVFQNAVCNWRCWYCYVPYNLLSGDIKNAAWMTARDLMDLYLLESEPALVIDLSGGQPDLTPEWIPWMMAEIKHRGLENSIYLWSDDNLSNDYFWQYLSDDQRALVAGYPNYGRVCCFKGFDHDSFSFNTRAAPELFDRQFQLMDRLLTTGIDIYAYATFTCANTKDIPSKIARFVDRLQLLAENLPLRTIPLEIQAFTPVQSRLNDSRQMSLAHQWVAIESWKRELQNRFGSAGETSNIVDVSLNLQKRRVVPW